MFGVVVFGVCILIICLAIPWNMFFGSKRSLKGKHVVITGGSSGIGLAMAIQVILLHEIILFQLTVELIKP